MPKEKKMEKLIYPRERKKKQLKQRWGKKKEKSKKTLSKISDFDPQEYLNKSVLFNLNKTSEEQIFYGIIKKLPTNDKY